MAYLLFFATIILLSYICKNNKLAYLLLFTLCVVFLGFRQNVGTDYQNYVAYFTTGDVFFFEPANQLVYYIAGLMGDEVKWTFFIYAFISYCFLFSVLNDYNNPTVSIFLIISTFTFLTNGIRQAAAIMIFFFASKFIKERKFFPYLVYILLASLFHTSIIIVLPIFFVAHKSLPKDYYILIYVISLIFTQLNISQIVAPFENLLALLPKYSRYVESRTEGYFSLGVLFDLLLYVFLLLLSLRHNLHKRYPIIFNMFFLAMIFFNMRIGAYIFNRIVSIFSIYRSVIAALLITDSLYFDKYRKLYSLIIIFSYLLLVFQAIFMDKNNCMIPYQNALF